MFQVESLYRIKPGKIHLTSIQAEIKGKDIDAVCAFRILTWQMFFPKEQQYQFKLSPFVKIVSTIDCNRLFIHTCFN